MMKTRKRLFPMFVGGALAILAILAAPSTSAQFTPIPDVVKLRFELPGEGMPVSVEPGIARVIVELPAGSSFPVDFSGVSFGMVESGKIDESESGIRVMLNLGFGRVSRIAYEPSAVVLELKQSSVGGSGEDDVADRYTLGAYDRLNLTIYNHPELSGQVSVSNEGTLTAPFVGEFPVAGMTPSEVATELARRLGEDYLKDPQVDVDVEKFRSQWVMVNGEVRNPGRVFLQGGTRLKEAISDANGFIETSGEEILISRETDDGNTEVVSIDREEFENGEVNPIVRSGDIVTVKGVEWAFLQGEIRQPTRVRIERGMTLMKAVALVGGLTDWANKKNVKVLGTNGGVPTIYNLKAIQNGRMKDPELRGGDIVVVERRFF